VVWEIAAWQTKQNKLLFFIDIVCHPREICGLGCQFFALKRSGAGAYEVLREYNVVSYPQGNFLNSNLTFLQWNIKIRASR
jgi:hypothetical protein